MERSRQKLHCCRNSDIIGRGWDGRQQGLNLQNYCIKEARVDLTCCTLPHPSRKLEQNENTLKILFQIISTKGSLLHRVRYLCYARARARACVCVYVWCSGLCSRFPIETLRVRSPPSTATFVFLLLLCLRWLPTAKCVCLSMSVLWKKSIIIKKWIVAGQKQPLGGVWCKTRLLNNGGQFDRLCNLIGGAVLAKVICACAYDYRRLRRWVFKGPKVYVCIKYVHHEARSGLFLNSIVNFRTTGSPYGQALC